MGSWQRAAPATSPLRTQRPHLFHSRNLLPPQRIRPQPLHDLLPLRASSSRLARQKSCHPGPFAKSSCVLQRTLLASFQSIKQLFCLLCSNFLFCQHLQNCHPLFLCHRLRGRRRRCRNILCIEIPVPRTSAHVSSPATGMALSMSFHAAGSFFSAFCCTGSRLLHLARDPFAKARPVKIHPSEIPKFLSGVS